MKRSRRAVPADDRAAPQHSKRATAIASGIGTAIGLLSGAAGLLFIIRPNLAPTAENTARITDVAIEPEVTLSQYILHPVVRSKAAEVRKSNPKSLTKVGTVVHFNFEVAGYTSKKLQTRWTLFDGQSGKRIADSDGLDPLPFGFQAEKRQADIGSWESWIYTDVRTGTPLVVRVELYDDIAGIRLTFKDSSPFTAPGQLSEVSDAPVVRGAQGAGVGAGAAGGRR